MKKTLLTLIVVMFSMFTYAQSSYRKTLDSKAEKISSAKSIADYDKLFNEFSDLTRNPDSYRWKAYYYTALVLYKKSEFLLASNKKSDISYFNGLAKKYVMGSLSAMPDDKDNNELMQLITEQKSLK